MCIFKKPLAAARSKSIDSTRKFTKGIEMFKRRLLLALFAEVVLVAGCGDVKFGAVRGTVTLDGKPVPHATVIFVPQNAKPRSPSYGATDKNGRYSLQFSRSRQGALLAEHSVQIVTEKLGKSELKELQEAADAGGAPVPEFVAVPKKYAAEGALTARVNRGRNEINFDLTSQ